MSSFPLTTKNFPRGVVAEHKFCKGAKWWVFSHSDPAYPELGLHAHEYCFSAKYHGDKKARDLAFNKQNEVYPILSKKDSKWPQKLSQKDVDLIKTKIQAKHIELEKENKKDVVKRLYAFYEKNVDRWVNYYSTVDSSMKTLRRLEKARWARQYIYDHEEMDPRI